MISVKGYSDVPAEDEVKKRGIKDSNDPKLEDATAELYKAEFHRGVMKENCDGFKGMKVSEAKQKVIEEMKRRNFLSIMQELPQKVVCKCGTRCYVKILENQWFLNYSDPAWKEKTKDAHQGRERLPRAVARVVLLDDRLAAQLALRAKVGDGDEAPLGQGLDSRDPLRLDHLHGVLHDLPVRQLREGQVRPAPARGLRLPAAREGLGGARLEALRA